MNTTSKILSRSTSSHFIPNNFQQRKSLFFSSTSLSSESQHKQCYPRHPQFTVEKASELLSTSEITSESLCSLYYKRAKYGEDILKLNSFTQLCSLEQVLEDAKQSDMRRKRNQQKSILDGLPVTIKSNIAVKNFPLTANSRILKNEDKNDNNNDVANCQFDAFVVRKLLRDCGAILIGVTTMDELGMGSLGTNVPYDNKIPLNPLPFLGLEEKERENAPLSSHHHQYYSTGGSSSGSASSVAFGSSLISIGTDTGGSIRLPSAWCGVVGFKPSYGWISRQGVVEYASSLDTIGLIGPTVKCIRHSFHALKEARGEDINEGLTKQSKKSYTDLQGDATIASTTNSSFFASKSSTVATITSDNDSTDSLKHIRIGIPSCFCIHEAPDYILDAWNDTVQYLHQQHGAQIMTIDSISQDIIQKSLASYYVLACAEASSNLSRYDGIRFGTPLSSSSPSQVDDHDINDNNILSSLSFFEQQLAKHRAQFFGEEVIQRILCGNAVLSSDRFHTFYENASKVRAILSQQFHQAFHDDDNNNERVEEVVDVMIVPTAMSNPWQIGNKVEKSTTTTTKAFENDILTVPMSLAGMPSISVPLRGYSCYSEKSKGIDVVGMQIFGPKGRKGEENVLLAADALYK